MEAWGESVKGAFGSELSPGVSIFVVEGVEMPVGAFNHFAFVV
jgi:hypothetical protein